MQCGSSLFRNVQDSALEEQYEHALWMSCRPPDSCTALSSCRDQHCFEYSSQAARMASRLRGSLGLTSGLSLPLCPEPPVLVPCNNKQICNEVYCQGDGRTWVCGDETNRRYTTMSLVCATKKTRSMTPTVVINAPEWPATAMLKCCPSWTWLVSCGG